MKLRLCILQIIFVFVSAYEPNDEVLGSHLIKHGDGVKDIAFAVEDLDGIILVSLVFILSLIHILLVHIYLKIL